MPQQQEIWSWLRSQLAEPAADRWLAWHPSELEACLAARGGYLPAPLATDELSELAEAHKAWGADGDSVAALARLGEANCRVIVTGQQPGLLAGPLLVVYKALAAIALARRLQQAQPGLKFVPVFWMAGEDHDFAEIRRVYWPGQAGGLEECLLNADAWQPGQMVGAIPTAPFLQTLLDQIGASAYRTEFSESVEMLLRDAYGGKKATLESGFARILLRLTAGTGLVVVSSRMSWLRRRAAALLEKEFAAPGQATESIRRRGEALRAAGYVPALHRHEGAINAFWIDEHNRRFAMRMRDGMVERAISRGDGEEPLTLPPIATQALVEELRLDPERFGMNVVTRPMLQDAALPTVAQVIGPGEAAYLAQVEAVYEQFGVFRPVRWPRPGATLLEPRVTRQLEKFGITIDDALAISDAAELARRINERTVQGDDLKSLRELRQRHLAELEAMRAHHATMRGGTPEPAVEGAFAKLAQAMEKGYATIEERALFLRQRDEGHLMQATAMIVSHLRPAGLPQERALNPLIPFAWNHGLDWVRPLAALLGDAHDAPHHVIPAEHLKEG